MAVCSQLRGCDCRRGNRLFCSIKLTTACMELSIYLFILPVLPPERKPCETPDFSDFPMGAGHTVGTPPLKEQRKMGLRRRDSTGVRPWTQCLQVPQLYLTLGFAHI